MDNVQAAEAKVVFCADLEFYCVALTARCDIRSLPCHSLAACQKMAHIQEKPVCLSEDETLGSRVKLSHNNYEVAEDGFGGIRLRFALRCGFMSKSPF
ncbi:hypothetical protein CEXT_542721 [Caerostris extrusa]|uniref:Uncharacterized protein n=1 Tax=Caerostris extrusa TaxID=172846 RepID=A0AAV4RGQ6_CAEEX|nr:hypothetical protein CEXT_542721 [Caerostris extrusa]